MQNEVYEKLDKKSHRWLECNIKPKKVASIIAVQEQIGKTRAWKPKRERDRGYNLMICYWLLR